MLEVSLVTWIVAFLPLAILLALMLGRNWGADSAGPISFLVAVLVALLMFGANAEILGFEIARGIYSSITVLYVVWASILLYEVTHEGQAFEPLRVGIERFLPHPLLQVLAFGWAFASFLQGVTGFGVPIAVVAPLLVGIGVRPIYAVTIPLIGHAWNNTFGTLAVAWLGLKQVTGIDAALAAETAIYAASFIWVLNILGGLLVCWLFDKARGIRDGLPVIIAMSLIQGGLTLALSQWSDVLNGFIASSVAFIAIFAFGRLPMYQKRVTEMSSIFTDERRAEYAAGSVTGGAGMAAQAVYRSPLDEPGTLEINPDGTATATRAATEREEPLTMNEALIPYYALLVITFGILLIPPIKNALGSWIFTISFPETVTSRGYVRSGMTANFALLTHAGTFLAAAALVAFFAFKAKGTIAPGGFGRVFMRTVEKSVPSTIAVVALIAMSNVLTGVGAVEILAHGVAVATGPAYGFLAPLVGGLGAFMTTSNLASNLLFGQFQLATANATGLYTPAILGAQTAGGAAGNMIAPGNVLLGTTTAGILGREGEVLKITIPLFVMVALIIGVFVFFVA